MKLTSFSRCITALNDFSASQMRKFSQMKFSTMCTGVKSRHLRHFEGLGTFSYLNSTAVEHVFASTFSFSYKNMQK